MRRQIVILAILGLSGIAALPAAAQFRFTSGTMMKEWVDYCSIAPQERVCFTVQLLVNEDMQVRLRVRNTSGSADWLGGDPHAVLYRLQISGLPPVTTAPEPDPYGYWNVYRYNPQTTTGPTSDGPGIAYRWFDEYNYNDGFSFTVNCWFDCNSYRHSGAIASGVAVSDLPTVPPGQVGPYRYFVTPVPGATGIADADYNGGWVNIDADMWSDWAEFVPAWSPENAELTVGADLWRQETQVWDNRAVACSTADGSCAQATPEPATLTLIGTGLLGLAAARRRKRKQTGTETLPDLS